MDESELFWQSCDNIPESKLPFPLFFDLTLMGLGCWTLDLDSGRAGLFNLDHLYKIKSREEH